MIIITRDVCETFMTPLYIHYRVHKPLLRAWMETANYWNFFEVKGAWLCQKLLDRTQNKLDLDILMINLYTKFHFNMCNQCKENERKLLVDPQTDRQTAAKQHALPSSKGSIIIIITSNHNCSLTIRGLSTF
jgi:hypothetical protein